MPRLINLSNLLSMNHNFLKLHLNKTSLITNSRLVFRIIIIIKLENQVSLRYMLNQMFSSRILMEGIINKDLKHR